MQVRDRSNHKRHVVSRTYIGTTEQLEDVRKFAHGLFKQYSSDKKRVRRAVKVINLETTIMVYDRITGKDVELHYMIVVWDYHAMWGTDGASDRFGELEDHGR